MVRTALRKNNLIPLSLIASLLVLGIGFEIHQILRIQKINSAIKQIDTVTIDDDTPYPVIFAKAWHLSQSGEFQAALQLYKRIENEGAMEAREKVLYNLGQIYLTQAAKYWNSQGVWAYSQVLAWTNLAESTLRQVVGLNPDNWNARFNLEFTYRIKPPPREVDKADWTGHRSSVHSVYPGIPGGGP